MLGTNKVVVVVVVYKKMLVSYEEFFSSKMIYLAFECLYLESQTAVIKMNLARILIVLIHVNTKCFLTRDCSFCRNVRHRQNFFLRKTHPNMF